VYEVRVYCKLPELIEALPWCCSFPHNYLRLIPLRYVVKPEFPKFPKFPKFTRVSGKNAIFKAISPSFPKKPFIVYGLFCIERTRNLPLTLGGLPLTLGGLPQQRMSYWLGLALTAVPE